MPSYSGRTLPRPSLATLPTECLQLILAYFDNDLSMLHNLALVNRHLFQLSIPLLYRSPFLLIKSFERDSLPWDNFKRQVKLLWLFLGSVAHHPWVQEELPPFATDFPLLRLPTKDRARLEDGNIYLNNGSRPSERNPPLVLTVDYLSFYTHHDHSTLSDAFPTLFPSLACWHMDQWSSSEDMVRIRTTIEKAFLMHRPESIVSMTLPISRMEIFLQAIPRLVRLRRIEFHDIKRDFKVEQAVEFVQLHDRLTGRKVSGECRGDRLGQDSIFNGADGNVSPTSVLLTEIKLGGPGDHGIIEKVALYKILQAMQQPKVIDLSAWRGAVLDLTQVPTLSLQVLRLRLDRPLPGDLCLKSFLSQCTQLQELQICIAPTHGSSFDGAAEHAQRIMEHTLVNGAGHIQKGEEGKPLVPLVNFNGFYPRDSRPSDTKPGLQILGIAGDTLSILAALKGATKAYSHSLKVLKVSCWKVQPDPLTAADPLAHTSGSLLPSSSPPYPTLQSSSHPSLSWTSPMTQLVHLELKGEIAAMAFDLRSLAHCPRLQTLSLNTRPCRAEPDPSSVERLMEHVQDSLRELELIGPWLVADWDLDKIASRALPRLQILKLVHCKIRDGSTPVLGESGSILEAVSLGLIKAGPSRRAMSVAGLMGAVQKLSSLRELCLGLDVGLETDRSTPVLSPVQQLSQNLPSSASSSVASFASFSSSSLESAKSEGRLPWTALPKALEALGRSRMPPLVVEIQHCAF